MAFSNNPHNKEEEPPMRASRSRGNRNSHAPDFANLRPTKSRQTGYARGISSPPSHPYVPSSASNAHHPRHRSLPNTTGALSPTASSGSNTQGILTASSSTSDLPPASMEISPSVERAVPSWGLRPSARNSLEDDIPTTEQEEAFLQPKEPPAPARHWTPPETTKPRPTASRASMSSSSRSSNLRRQGSIGDSTDQPTQRRPSNQKHEQHHHHHPPPQRRQTSSVHFSEEPDEDIPSTAAVKAPPDMDSQGLHFQPPPRRRRRRPRSDETGGVSSGGGISSGTNSSNGRSSSLPSNASAMSSSGMSSASGLNGAGSTHSSGSHNPPSSASVAASSVVTPSPRPPDDQTNNNNDAATNTNMSEDEQLQAILRLSAEEEARNSQRRSSSGRILTRDEIEEANSAARNLYDAATNQHDIDFDLLQSLQNTCQHERDKIQECIEAVMIQGGDVTALIELNEFFNTAMEQGERAIKDCECNVKKPPSYEQSNSLDIDRLVMNQDIFTLICTLRAQQNSRRLDATLALMRFARSPHHEDLRDEIRSSGGMHSLLTLFRTRGCSHELKVVACLAVAYMLPSFFSDSQTTPSSLGLKIIECIRFLSTCEAVSPHGEYISKQETFRATLLSLTAFWLNYLGPKLNAEGALANGGLEKAISSDSFSLGRARTMRASSSSNRGVVLDQRRENIALRELVEITVTLIVYVANEQEKHRDIGPNDSTPTLVEQVCAVEIARPLAVREGILQILVGWLRSTNAEQIRAATNALRYLTSIKDKYMAGWIHSEMVNKGAVKALADLTHRPSIGQDMVRLAIAQILASLCVAPHTRAAVVEANCIGFLVGFLYVPADLSSDDVVFSAGTALVQLAVGAITRATFLSGEDMVEVHGFVSSDKSNTLVDDMLEGGAIASFVSIARERKGKLRSVAIEALRILSEDVDLARQTRLRLCDGGAASALGITLKDDVSLITANRPLDRAFMAMPADALRRLHQSVCTLANILDPVKSVPNKNMERTISAQIIPDPREVLIKGCLDTAKDGGLDSILKIAALSFNASNLRDTSTAQQGANTNLLEEACRSLASMAPFLLSRTVADAGHATCALRVLRSLHDVLKQLVAAIGSGQKGVTAKAMELHEVVMQGLGALSKSDPLKIRIIDRTLPFLLKALSSRDSTSNSSAVSQALQSLDLAEDEIDSAEDAIAMEVAGNNPGLIADWFCLQRALLIQAMARAEIRQIIVNTWDSAFVERNRLGLTNLIRSYSDKSRSDDGTAPPDLFDNFANDENIVEKRDRLVQQYFDIYGQGQDPDAEEEPTKPVQTKSGRVESIPEKGLLEGQMYPLSSCRSEMEWVLRHREFASTIREEASHSEATGSPPLLSNHSSMLLDTCFPSRLLRDQIVPITNLRPEASFNFRALMMPQRRYFSFRREGKLLSRICDKEAATLDDTDVHWSLGFTNSSFDGEFAESLVQLLYLCPMIRGLSFARDEKSRGNAKESDCGDGSELLASLAGSLPPWISHLTFDGVLTQDDVSTLVSILETVGKLSSGQDTESGESSSDLVTNSQGRFLFLAVRKSPYISPDVWQKFFGLFASKTSTSQDMNTTRPLSSLKSLDLSFNNLGDDLCASILRIVYNQEFSCCLEELDLSGNEIRGAGKVVRELRSASKARREMLRKQKRAARSPLHTLILASNSIRDAWHEILAILQHDAFRLRVLDLSSNDIFLTDYDQTETLVRSILKSRDLVRLNLSNNRLNSKAVDDMIGQLSDSSSFDCALGFLELQNNDPPLTEKQNEALRTFLSRSRQVLLDRCVADRQSNKPKAEDEPETLLIVDPLDDQSVYPDFPDGTSVLSQETHDASITPSDNLITVLFSAPLVFKAGGGNLRPFPKLNFDMERELIWQCLKEASRDIELSFDNATHDRLLATIAKRCSCLHYSGHGHKDYLPFEDGTGGPKWFPVDQFKSLIEREGTAPFRFVFVSACYSGLAGETFASAGVPHVVCCQQEYELKDAAALAFTRQFYLALAVGNTVKESFEQGCKAVRATPNLKNAEEEMKKFVLLPHEGNHDVPIFKARHVREWPRSLSEEARRLRRNSRMGRRGQIAARSSELMVRNLLQEDPSPSPPQFFLGREVEMYQVLKQLFSRRLVSVVGEAGIGRSSLVCGVCHYINERKNIMSTVIERIYFVKAKQYRKKNRFVALIKQLLKKLVDEAKVEPVEEDDDVELIIEAICKGLKNSKALIVFDRVELLGEDSDQLNEFPMLIRELCRETSNVKILLTNRHPLGIPSLGEHPVKLGPLNFESTVKLFAHLCPYIHTPADRRRLSDSLVGSKEEGELLPGPDIPEETKMLFDMLGRGKPSRIENAAFCVHKDDLSRLRDGSFREE